MSALDLRFLAAIVGALALACGCDDGSADEGRPRSAGDAAGEAVQVDSAAVSSSASSGGDGAGPPDGPWLPVAGLERCSGVRLDLAHASWPKRTWAACGPGCLESSAYDHVAAEVGAHGSSAASMHDGTLYLRTSLEGKTERYVELLRGVDGDPALVLRLSEECFSGLIKFDAPFVIDARVGTGGTSSTINEWIARFDPTSGALTPQTAPVDVSIYATAWFTLASGWGVADPGAVKISVDPATAPTTVFTSNAGVLAARGRGGMAIWTDASVYPNQIRRWTATDGVANLLADGGVVAAIALGDEKIAWVSVQGQEVSQGTYDSARIYWSPVSKDASGIQPHMAVDVSGSVAGVLLPATAGDFIAVTTTQSGDGAGGGGAYVHRISTGKTWFIPARPKTWMRLMGISATELLVSEQDVDAQAAYFRRYVRLSLDSLDDLAKGWSGQ